MSTSKARLRQTLAVAFSIAISVVIAATVYHYTRLAPRSFVRELVARVPAAREILAFNGKGFQRSRGGGLPSDVSAVHDGDRSQSIVAEAPALADGSFHVGASGSDSRTAITLQGAANVPALLEHGVVVYRSAYPDTDVIAVRDPGHVELAYVVHNVEHAPALVLDVAPPESGGTVSREPGTGAIIVRAATKRPTLRIEPPIAFDRAGHRRVGRYDLKGTSVRLDISLDGLVPPVVVDPAFAIPLWSVLSDGRAPGAVVYNPASGSRETRVFYDPQSASTILTRPIRSQQFEDSTGWFAQLSRPQARYISPITRMPAAGGPSITLAQRLDWQRTFYTESETWKWANSKWSLLDSAGLPGRIDPALAFDATRQKVIMAGGQATTDFACSTIDGYGGAFTFRTGEQCTAYPDTGVYEFDGATWTNRPITGAPPPRVRNSLTNFTGGMLLFGGRRIGGYRDSFGTLPYGPPFPDSMAEEVLNDTWFYDGFSWQPRPTNYPPPARESPRLVFDATRSRAVLVGGYSATGEDSFDLWEFDGTDWIRRFAVDDPTLPLSLRGRTGELVAWNPARGTTLILGGVAKRLDACTLSESDIRVQSQVPARKQALTELGCFGGYVHDSWEWDGATLRQLTRVAFGGYVGQMPVFRQITEQAGWGGGTNPQPVPTPVEGGKTPRLPWRYDASPNHFQLRSALERAHTQDATTRAPVVARSGSAVVAAAPTTAVSFVSPLFASTTSPQMSFDTARGVATLFMPEDGRIFETDGKTWVDRSPISSPFASGGNDFFGAAWDSTAQRILLFDPITASTWAYGEIAGWSKLNPVTSPPVWTVDPSVRRERDLERERSSSLAVNNVAAVAKQIPHVTYDRARSRVVMLYRDSLWEFDGATWEQKSAPPGWASCTAATLIAYDGRRAKTVAVGCKTPGETMEWDGSSWTGPLASPYKNLVYRNGVAPAFTWYGTLQLTWAHPNALFESTLNAGVSMLDSGGVMRTWDGTTWLAGAAVDEGYRTDWGQGAVDPAVFYSETMSGLPPNGSHSIDTGEAVGAHVDFMPLSFFPPMIEDPAHGRILAFRDGATGMREWRPGATRFDQVPLGDLFRDFGNPTDPYGISATRVHPHPFELLSAEHIYLRTSSDPASRVMEATFNGPNVALPGGPPKPGDGWRIPESEVNNLFWPFRLFVDPVSQRIRVLTHRGAVWELGAEVRQGLGDACTADADCTVGYCIASLKHPGTNVCCNQKTCGSSACQTCEGDTPGVCQNVPAGQPEPYARCGSGDCAGLCSGQASCVFAGGQACGAGACASGVFSSASACSATSASCIPAVNASSNCPGGLGCATATSCLTHCSTNSDCADSRDMCSPNGNTCVPNPLFEYSCSDGRLSKRGQPGSAACAGALGCASATSCKAACTSRTDCQSPFQQCGGDHLSCVSDAVSIVASQRGLTPSTWKPQVRRTPQELADKLAAAGYPKDEAGNIILDTGPTAGVSLAFNPHIFTPQDGFRACTTRIRVCREQTNQLDACVAAAPRCVLDHASVDDPAGFDCCPSQCLLEYFDNRTTQTPAISMLNVVSGTCYPGLREYLLQENSP